MKFEQTEVFNFEGAFRGMRNPLASWHRTDSSFGVACEHEDDYFAQEVAYAWAEHDLKDKEFESEDNCFPFCIDVKRKVIYITNANFLREFASQGNKMISVNKFKKVMEV